MKPHYRLRFHLFDGKTPLWWVSKTVRIWLRSGWDEVTYETGGYRNSGEAIRAAARL